MRTFYQILTDAVNDIATHGYDTQKRVDHWLRLLKDAAARSMVPEAKAEQLLNQYLSGIYSRLVVKQGVLKLNKHVKTYSLNRLKPSLRAELDRRTMASQALIKFNREESVNNTMRRFQGWATSIPKGGSDSVDKVTVKQDIKKAMQDIRFKERRVAIDQGHKLAANINDIVCVDSGAIAAIWHSTHQAGYNNRKDHLERDNKIYVVKDGWAYEKKLIKPKYGFTNDITMPGEEVFCRCRYQYVFNLSDLPTEMLTAKGKKLLQSK